MLEGCLDLASCETTLAESTRHVEYLGEVNFSFSDIEKLAALLKNVVVGEENVAGCLRKYPACVSFYLVGRGITAYSGGNFWTPVNQELGLQDTISQYRVGAVFRKFLQDNKLHSPRIKSALPFVSPILLHGGMPQSCRKQFYEVVIKYLLERKLVNEDEIRSEIARLREREKKRAELADVRDELRLRCQKLEREVETLDKVIRLNRRRQELAGRIPDRDDAGPDYDSLLADARQERATLTRTIEDLRRRQDECLAVIRRFTPEDRILVRLGGTIDHLAGAREQYRDALRRIPTTVAEVEKGERRLYDSVDFPAPGGEEFAADLPRTIEREFLDAALGAKKNRDVCNGRSSPEELVSLIKEQPNLDGWVTTAEAWCGRLVALRDAGRNRQRYETALSAIEPAIADWEATLHRVTDGLSSPPAGSPKDVLDELGRRRDQACLRKNLASMAGYLREREIAPALAGARAGREEITREISLAQQFVRDLGEGDLQVGLRRLGEKYRALLEWRDIEEELHRFKAKGFSSGLDEGAAQAAGLARELRNVRKYLDLKEEQIELQAFLTETGHWAGLPDYAGFMLETQAELDVVDGELEELGAREMECAGKINSFTPADRRILEFGSVIRTLADNLHLYRAGRKKQGLLTTQVNECTERISALAAALWPDDWQEGYALPVTGLDITALQRAWDGCREARQAYREVEQRLADTPAVKIRPGKEFWWGLFLAAGGAGLLPTGLADAGYPVGILGLALLAVGCFRLSRTRGEKVEEERRREDLEKELRAAGAAVTNRQQRLRQLLHGLPVPNLFQTADGDWVRFLGELQEVCRERDYRREELIRHERILGQWEAAVQELATALPGPVGETPERLAEELAHMAGRALRRRREAFEARNEVEMAIGPATRRLLKRRAAIEASRAAVEREFRDLGGGDPAVGQRRWAQRKAALTRLRELEGELGGFVGLKPLPGWEEAVRLEERLLKQLEDLKRYLALKKELRERRVITGDPGEWEQFVDYGSFIASREAELAALAPVIAELEEREARYIEEERRFSPDDRFLVAQGGTIGQLYNNLEAYEGWIDQRDILSRQIGKCRDEVDSLVDRLWPGGWEGGYPCACGWSRDGFVHQLVCCNRLEEWLGRFVAGLKTMQEAHRQYRCWAAELTRLQETVADWNDKWQRVVTKVPSSSLDDVCQRLDRARTRAREAATVGEVFRTQVWPQLVEAQTMKSALDGVIAEMELQLRELGAGDQEEGLRRARERRRSVAELAALEQELAACTAGLSLSPGRWDDAAELRAEKAADLESVRTSLNLVESQIAACHSFLYGTDEPVQRFVLHGGDWAVKWLYAGVALHRYHLGEDMDLTPVIDGLPARVFRDLDDLVGSVREDDAPAPQKVAPPVKDAGPKKGTPLASANGKTRKLSEEFPRPELVLDVEHSELKLRVGGYRFYLYDPAAKPKIRVQLASGEESLPWQEEIVLPGYREDGTVKVPVVPCTLPVLAANYLVTAHIGGIRYDWEIESFNHNLPYLLFTETGKQIETNRPARERLWLAHPAGLTVEPAGAVLSESSLPAAGRELRLALIDLGRYPVVYLTSGGQRCYEIGTSPGQTPSAPYLSEEGMALGARGKDDRPVYVGDVPRLVLPIANPEDMAAWSMVLEGLWPDGSCARTVSGREIVDLGVAEAGRLKICLDDEHLLGRRPLGEYSIRLKQADQREYRFDLTILMGLDLFFERWLYFPWEGEGRRIRLNVILPEPLAGHVRVKVRDPARLTGQDDDEVHVETHAGSGLVGLELVYRSGGRIGRASISVEVPRVTWRLRTRAGTEEVEWHERVLEVWHEDLYGGDNPRLEVTVPGYLPEPVKRAGVFLDGGGQRVEGRFAKGIWAFDLAGLADSLRSGAEVRTLTLVLEDDRGRRIRDGQGTLQGTLVTVRTCWRAADLACEVEECPGGITLRASWTDLGRPPGRVARLWRLAEPWASPSEVPVDDGAQGLKRHFDRTGLPPGSYLFELAEDDPWGGEAEFPADQTGCREIRVGSVPTRVIIDECRWEDEDVLVVDGTVTNAAAGAQVTLGLFGVVKGSPRVSWHKTTSGENGRFGVLLRGLADQSLRKTLAISLKAARPHWLAVMADGSRVYRFELLPDPGGVWWPLGSPQALAGGEGLGEGRLFIDCQEASLDQPLLNDGWSKKFRESLSRGRNPVALALDMRGRSETASLLVENGSNRARLELKTGAIICTTCHKIEPDQASWYANHSTLAPKCKGFRYDVRKLVAGLYWYWDITPRLAVLGDKYALAGRHPLMLFDNVARPLPDYVWSDQEKSPDFNLETLVAALWEREVTLLNAVGR